MMSELALSVNQTAVTNINLLIDIVQTVHKVKHFKAQCHDLGNLAASLLAVLQNNQSVITALHTAQRLENTLKETHRFMVQCMADWSYLQIGLELIIAQRVPHLKEDLLQWMLVFGTELSVYVPNPFKTHKIYKTDDWVEYR